MRPQVLRKEARSLVFLSYKHAEVAPSNEEACYHGGGPSRSSNRYPKLSHAPIDVVSSEK